MKGKPPELAFISVVLAMSPDLIYGGFGEIYSGAHDHPELRVPDIDQWAQLYHSPKRILKGCWTHMGFGPPEDFEYKDVVAPFLAALEALLVSNDREAAKQLDVPDVPPEVFKPAFYDYLFAKLEDHASQRVRNRTADRSAEGEDSLDVPIECIFFFRVWVACWLVQKEPFWPLYKRARHGDIEAIEKLVLVDRNVLCERRIAKLWAEISEDNESEEFERIHRTLAKRPHLVRYEMREAKLDVAGLIARMSEAKGHSLNPSQIGELFNALARDLAPEDQHVHKDPDIHRKSDQWRKAVNRRKSEWSESPFFTS
ncbi:MAG: hypothetical protein JW741_09965 [Sedimentisphaerales bacterium]|nr:hypothetical protein [Sedimentisphaerales bacterium]